MILDLSKYENYNITINENFNIIQININQQIKLIDRGISKKRTIINFINKKFKMYIRSRLIIEDNINMLPPKYLYKVREIYKKYYKLEFMKNLFCNDVFDIIISYLIV